MKIEHDVDKLQGQTNVVGFGFLLGRHPRVHQDDPVLSGSGNRRPERPRTNFKGHFCDRPYLNGLLGEKQRRGFGK